MVSITAEQRQIAQLAFGRILVMGARPCQPGDISAYESCRALILDALEGVVSVDAYQPNYARDRFKGAQG